MPWGTLSHCFRAVSMQLGLSSRLWMLVTLKVPTRPSFLHSGAPWKNGPWSDPAGRGAGHLALWKTGLGVVEGLPTGGMKEAFPDGLVRLQPGGVGNRVSTLCSQISLYLQRAGQRQSQGQGRRSYGRKRQGQRVGQVECPTQACSYAAYNSDGLLQLPFYRAGSWVSFVFFICPGNGTSSTYVYFRSSLFVIFCLAVF